MAWLYPCTDFTDSYYYQLVTPARFVTPAKAGVQFPRHPGAMIEIPPKFAGKPPVNPEENPPAR